MKGLSMSKRKRRMLAGLLAFILLAANIMSGVTTVYGAEKRPVADAYYLLDADQLNMAIMEATETGAVFDFDSLAAEEDQGGLEGYRRLLGADSGEVYELQVDAYNLLNLDGVNVQVLYDAAEDRVILLFINEDAEELRFRAQIGDYITSVVRVKSAWPEDSEVPGKMVSGKTGSGGGGAGAPAGGMMVPQTDADGNIINGAFWEVDADGNIIGEAVPQTGADGTVISEAVPGTEEYFEDGGSVGGMSGDTGLQDNEDRVSGETQGMNSENRSHTAEFWSDSEDETSAADESAGDAGLQENEDMTSGETQGTNSENDSNTGSNTSEFWSDSEDGTSAADEQTEDAGGSSGEGLEEGGSGKDSESSGSSGMDSEPPGSSNMDSEISGGSDMDSEVSGVSNRDTEADGGADSGEKTEIGQSEPVAVAEILNNLVPLSGTILSDPDSSGQETEAPTERETEAPTERETEAPTERETEAPTERETEAPTEREADVSKEQETEGRPEREAGAPEDLPVSGSSGQEPQQEGQAGSGDTAVDSADGSAPENEANGSSSAAGQTEKVPGSGGGTFSGGGFGSGGGAFGAALKDIFSGSLPEADEEDPLILLTDEEVDQYKKLLFGATSGADEKSYPNLSIYYGEAYARALSISADQLGLAGAPLAISEESQDIRDLLTDVTITDMDGKRIDPQNDSLFVGNRYRIELEFSEVDVHNTQFDTESGILTYQIPTGFRVEPKSGEPLWVEIDGRNVQVGTYSIDKNGLMTITLSDTGREELNRVYDATLVFDMEGTLTASAKDGDGTFNFGGAGGEFTFQVVDQPCVSVEKNGVYTENDTATGGTLAYTVKTTVEHGELHDGVVTDVLTPPQTNAFELKMATKEDGKTPDVTVTVKRKEGDGEITLQCPDDYRLVAGEDADPNNPQALSFRVELLGKYAELYEGDELDVVYNYNVGYVEGATQLFWGNVANDVTVTGTMPVENPDDPENPDFVKVEEHQGSNVEIQAIPTGEGVICKDQQYSEETHTLHYTLYTMVPAGRWAPLFIQDDMVVEYNKQRWYIPEFKEGGRVQNLEVYAVDVEDEQSKDFGDLTGSELVGGLAAYKDRATKLTGYSFLIEDLEGQGYDPSRLDNYVYRYGDATLNIIFGLDQSKRWEEYWGTWGSWEYGKPRLIITEYDLNMSENFGKEITLKGLDNPEATLTLTPNEVLLAGITNNVNLRYSRYYPGYKVFFNNVERMNKTGKLNKEDNTIEYTVSLNTTDRTVLEYFKSINKEWYDLGHKYEWSPSKMYPESMQTVFYDKLPEGWEYVEDSLYATTRDKYGNEYRWDDLSPVMK